MEYLGLPGLLEPEQVRLLLSKRQAAQVAAAPAKPARDPSAFEVLQGLRKELNGLVGAWHHRTGTPHGAIHAQLRKECGGPPTAVATAQQVQDRIEVLRRWAQARR
jgi:hypothetical protein